MKRVLLLTVLLIACGRSEPGGGTGDDDTPPGPDAAEPIPDAQVPTENVTEVVCEALPPTTNGATCEITPGGATKLLKGIVLTPSTIYRGGQVAVNAAGAISCVGCNCAAGGETVIACPDGAISPGLINTHDHITFTQNQPYTDSGERYEHRHQWRVGQDMHTKIESQGRATADQIRWGELRFLMGGATSIVGSGGQPGLLRNLDSTSQQEGLGQGAVNFDTFPLDDSGGNRRTSDCNYGAGATTAQSIANNAAYEPHTAEGIDKSARNEFLCQSSDSYDATAPGVSHNLLLGKTAMIHAIGLSPADLGAMAQAGTGLIWSPRSNITLYGDTARVAVAARLGVEIALGTDWMPTGSMSLLRELKCADTYNQTYLHYFTDSKLWQMVTTNAAALTATDDVIGSLAVGKVADITVFRANGGKTFRAVIDAEPADVALVMRGGKTLYGDDTAVAALAESCDVVDVCGTSKRVCLSSEIGKDYATLQGAVASSYPAFTCGAPEHEPSCTPSRPTSVNRSTIYTGIATADDLDGDGIANATDKCPTTFDPARPLDNGIQPDADNDGEGDACDPCPLDAGTSTCTVVDPSDRDHDGKPNDVDNCPDVANPGQEDADGDGHGDVCDACPATPNPGASGCAVSIYSIKDGTTAVGTAVRVNNALVTGKGSNGFFVQVKDGDAGYAGADYSGLFVFAGANAPTLGNAVVGARVNIEGKVASFQGQIELDNVTLVESTGAPLEAAPAPVAATYAEVKTGGSRAAQLEGVIVALGAAEVTAIDAEFGEFTLTAGGDALPVDDFLFAVTPPPAIGTGFSAVRGILTLRQSVSKLEVRDLADFTAGAPGLLAFSPALSFARVGVTVDGETFPAGSELTVTLTGPAQGDTTVTLTSADDSVLGVTDVVVPDGATSARAHVTARQGSATPVVVTATLGGRSLTAEVHVLDATEEASTLTLTPPQAAIRPNETITYTVTLDLPALGDTEVSLVVTPADAGTVPPTVAILAGQRTATFTYTDLGVQTAATVTATSGALTSSAAITVSTGANHLVINEVEYDEQGNDDAEFIELYNPTGVAISLANLRVILVNGASNGSIYDTIELDSVGELPAHTYLVLARPNVSVPVTAKKLDTDWDPSFVQNGAPDGIALIDGLNHTVIDAISYEGSCPTIKPPGFATAFSLVEGTAATATDAGQGTSSLCRFPDGTDTDVASADWAVCAAGSPGVANTGP